MIRRALLSLFSIAACACAVPAPPDASATDAAASMPDRDEPSARGANEADASATDGDAASADAALEGERACEFVLAARSHLRPIATGRSIGPMLESATRVRYLAARTIERNGAVLTRVRTREPVEREGYLFIERETLARCQRTLAPADPSVLEQATVVIDGHAEQWRVRAARAAHRECMGAIEDEGCGCWSHRGAWASDEREQFVLERVRDGAVLERVPLRTHRMGAHFSDDRSLRSASLARLAHASLLDVADYDHDGVAAEFVITGDSIACGRERATLYGVGRDGHLRAIEPRNDGALTEDALEAVRASATGITVTWECGANLADTRELLRWSSGADGLVMRTSRAPCPDNEPFE